MIKNYLIIAIRNFWRNKIFSLINVSGLAIGISAALVIYLIVQYEFSFEKFRVDKSRIYRVVSKIEFPDLTIHNSGVPVPTVGALKKDASGLENVTHFITVYDVKVAIPVAGNISPTIFRKQNNVIYADENYFKTFTYTWLSGSQITALKNPYQVVLTESRARLYFPNVPDNQIPGKQITYDDSLQMTVAGVVKDPEGPTDFRFKEFISRATIESTGLKGQWSWDEWGSINSSSQLFVKLDHHATPSQIEKQLADIRNKYRENKDKAQKDDTKHLLQPLTDIHFNSDYDAFGSRQARKPILFALLAVAGFLLALGCINFINLTTAQASKRAKEIGVRKTMGGGQGQLIAQFMGETFALTMIAAVLSIALTPWLLNIFKEFIPEGVSFKSINQPHVWVFMLATVILVSVLSGLYPALILSKFKPVSVLKNQGYGNHAKTGKALLRKVLIVTQFVIAQFLLIATLVFSRQIHYSLNKDLGYRKDAIVYFNTDWNIFSNEKDNRRFVLMEKLRAIPEIEQVSLSGSAPASTNVSTTTMKFKNEKTSLETMVEVKFADTGYFKLYGMKLLAGSNLKQSDTTKEFVINENFAHLLGFKNPEEAIGRYVERDKLVPVTGVVADFHTKSTREAIKPLAFSSSADNSYVIHMLLKPRGSDIGLWERALAKTEKAFKQIYPEDEFTYQFFDQSIAAFYKTEQDILRLLKWAVGLCIFISCLGLLGLVIYTTNMRVKEIGVRKVLGASVLQIVTLLSRDLLSLVLIAFVIASPFAWFAMHKWLEDFAYHVGISWWIFLACAGGMCFISLAILGIRTMRAAMANPVKSLRTE